MSIDVGTLNSLGLTSPTQQQPTSNSNQQDMFLKLMMTQLQNQNPLKPQDSSEFLSQLAQFSMVTGIQQLQNSFSGFASSMGQSQSLQAANLVGKNVLISSDQGILGATGKIQGQFDLPDSASAVGIKILGANGVTLRTMEMGPTAQGTASFEWDGMLDDRVHYADPGTYTIQVEAQIGGENVALKPKVEAPVESVTLGGSTGIEVDLGVLGRHGLKDIAEIM